MTLTAYYRGRHVWTAEGAEWPPGLDLEPASDGWRYVLTDWRIGVGVNYGELAN